MQIEQSAELNKHVDPSIPLTLAYRWQELRRVLPLLLCCSIISIESLIFRLWLNDGSLTAALPLLLVGAMAPVVLVLAAFELQVRVSHHTKRRIKLEEKLVSISPAKCNRIAWKRIVCWRFEPISQAPDLCKLTMEYSMGKKSRACRQWSMVLRQQDQEQALLSELEHFRQVGSNVAPLVRGPELPKPAHRHVGGTVALALSFFCLVHGLPLLSVGLASPNRHATEAKSASKLTPREAAKLQETVTRFFPSARAFRTFLLAAGGGTTALGAGFYLLALSSLRKAAKPAVNCSLRSDPTHCDGLQAAMSNGTKSRAVGAVKR